MHSNHRAGPSSAAGNNAPNIVQKSVGEKSAKGLENSLIVAVRAITFVVLVNRYENDDLRIFPREYYRWCNARAREVTKGARHCLRCFGTEEIAVIEFNKHGESLQATFEWLFSDSARDLLPNFHELCCNKITSHDADYTRMRCILHFMAGQILNLKKIAHQLNVSPETYTADEWLKQFYQVFDNNEKLATPGEVRQRLA